MTRNRTPPVARLALLATLLLLAACESIAWKAALERSCQGNPNCHCETEDCARRDGFRR